MSYVSHADLGGQTGWGSVDPETDEPVFHAPWEARALALTLAMGATGCWNLDASRSARETLPDYLRLSYYQVWLAALEKLMLERGLLTPDEVATGQMHVPPLPVAKVLAASQVAQALARGSPTVRPVPAMLCAARFAVGQPVRTRQAAAGHHTRLPAYARGKRGVIERVHGPHVFADSHAQGLGEDPQWLYSVAFSEDELWPGRPAQQGLTVALDAWEPYLEAI